MELWDLYTKDRIKTGRTIVRGDIQPEDTYRIVVHICVFNSRGEMLIQQRQPFKSGWSNMWDISVGGSAVAGETSATAAERELREELGIEICFKNILPILTLNVDGGFDDVYLVEKDVALDSLTLQYEEVQTTAAHTPRRTAQHRQTGNKKRAKRLVFCSYIAGIMIFSLSCP